MVATAAVLERLDPREYEHPLDKRALDALEGTRGVSTLVRKFHDLGAERILRIRYTGSNLKVTASSLPHLHGMLEDTCEVLNLAATPELYLQRGDHIQGACVGVGKPLIVLGTEAVESLTDAELRFVIGREVAHVKSQHVLYHDMGLFLGVVGNAVGAATLGLGSLLTIGIQAALAQWIRTSEYTADRAGLLACQEVHAAASVLAKIAGLPRKHYDDFNVDDFVTQAREFEGMDAAYDRLLKFSGMLIGEQLWAVVRAGEFLSWVDGGGYRDVLARKTEIRQLAVPRFCTNCGAAVETPSAFCPGCGAPRLP